MASLRDTYKKAEKLEADRKYADAAVLWEQVGEHDRAINAYKRGGAADQAARLCEMVGRHGDAAALYASFGQYIRAASIYEKIREFQNAARWYLRANNHERAAVMYEKAEAYEDAAKVYYSLGNFTKAIQLYEKAGMAEKAREIAQQEGIQMAQPGQPPVASAEGVAAQQLQDLDPLLNSTTEAYMDERRVVDGVVQLLRAGRVADAARVYSHCREDIGYPVIAACAGDRELEVRLAQMFVTSKDFYKAAQVFENLEDYPRAAVFYERCDDNYMAAEMYVKVGDVVKAAECFERNGNFQQAAEFFLKAEDYDRAASNFEKSVNHFLAGKLYFKMQKFDKSLQLLQKVQRSEHEYFEACRLIGEILASNGYLDLAIKKYLEVVQASELNQETAPIFYNLAITLEQRGSLDQAKAIFEKLLAWDFGYRDVNDRLQNLGKGAQQAPTPTPQPQTPPAPQEVAAADLDMQPIEETERSTDAGQVLESMGVQFTTPDQARAQLVTMMDGFEFLKDTDIFRELSLEEMKLFYHAMETRDFSAGATLIEQDQPGQALFIVREGNVLVKKVSATEEDTLAKLGPGSPLGEMSLFDDAPTSARVVAEGQVKAFVMTKESFDRLLSGSDKLALKVYRVFMKTLADRLRVTNREFAKAVIGRPHGS